MKFQEFIDRIFNLIGNDKTPQAVQETKSLLSKNELFYDSIIQFARYKDIIEQIRDGNVSFENDNLTLNQIKYALIEIVQEVEVQSENHANLKNQLKNTDFSKFTNSQTISIEDNYSGGENNINIAGVNSGNDTNINIDKQ